MIPQRTAGRENSGNAVRYRVAACRMRLRFVRSTVKTSNHHIPAEEECCELRGSSADSVADLQALAFDAEQNSFGLAARQEAETT